MSDALILPPNMEALVSAYLRDQPEVLAELDDGDVVHVYTAIPKDAPNKVVRVTQIADTPIGGGDPLHLVAFDIQVEAWGSKSEAWRVANLCRALLSDRTRIVGIHEGFGVVNGSSAGPMLDLPDEDFRPAVPRWLFTSTIYAHGLATLTS